MIKRSANKQGLITFNISFQHLYHNNSSPKIDTAHTSLYNTDQSHASFLSYRSNPLTPLENEDQKKALRHESRSISSDIDGLDTDEPQNFEYPNTKLFHHSHTNDENISRAVTEEFLTQEPIDFDDLQRVTKSERDDEDKSSAASTLSKSSKKIAKAKAGFVYKESRFKEEARNKGKRQAWQPHEDDQVLEFVAKHGQSWALIASMMDGRSGKQIRDRYLNKLRPDIKNDEWTREEDRQLISLFHTIGRKWSKIATQLPGRTEGQVKNRFYSHLQKRVLPLDQSDYASASPEGEMSPASKVNEIVHKKAPAERKFFREIIQNNSGYKLDKDNNKMPQMPSINMESNYNNFREQNNLYETSFQYAEPAGLEVNEQGFRSGRAPDPTDVISYGDMPNSSRKSLSPEKYPNKRSFINEIVQQNNRSFFKKETGSNSFIGSEHDGNTSFVELANEFKVRCNTNNLGKPGLEAEEQSLDRFLNKDVYNDHRAGYNHYKYNMMMNGHDFPRENVDRRENRLNFANTTGLQGMSLTNSLDFHRYQKENSNMF